MTAILPAPTYVLARATRIGLVTDLLGGRAFSGPFIVWQHGMPEPIASGTA